MNYGLLARNIGKGLRTSGRTYKTTGDVPYIEHANIWGLVFLCTFIICCVIGFFIKKRKDPDWYKNVTQSMKDDIVQIKKLLKYMMYFCMFLLVLFCLNYCGEKLQQIENERHQQEQQQLQQYLNSPVGQDETARKQSLKGDVILSKTGKQYYRGMLCTKDCSGHQAGYEWAWDLGVTNEDACDRKSESFKEGCLEGIKDVILDLRQYFKDEYPEDCDNDYIENDEQRGFGGVFD